MTAVFVKAPLTPKSDKKPHVVKLKVFWKTSRKWTSADISDYQNSVPAIAEMLRKEQYWDKEGNIHSNEFTCEDFAIRVLCEYAEAKGLPLKLTTGVRVYRNMEIYKADEHDRYATNKYGFSEMVMLSFGAADIQRVGVNTESVAQPADLLPGDILALAHDAKGSATGGRAHHIQVVFGVSAGIIDIYQGNSDYSIHRPITWINKLVGRNAADPQQNAYAGKLIEIGKYTAQHGGGWDYVNITTKNSATSYLKYFDFFRWNFSGFNT